ncbi:hypothetical protein [Nonomuraea bangladeshensis]|uniref:hypothetical protein n=1 Tax=Nonomuraea bangladeshensis TaxID=404385 RepID=UPI003C2C959C
MGVTGEERVPVIGPGRGVQRRAVAFESLGQRPAELGPVVAQQVLDALDCRGVVEPAAGDVEGAGVEPRQELPELFEPGIRLGSQRAVRPSGAVRDEGSDRLVGNGGAVVEGRVPGLDQGVDLLRCLRCPVHPQVREGLTGEAAVDRAALADPARVEDDEVVAGAQPVQGFRVLDERRDARTAGTAVVDYERAEPPLRMAGGQPCERQVDRALLGRAVVERDLDAGALHVEAAGAAFPDGTLGAQGRVRLGGERAVAAPGRHADEDRRHGEGTEETTDQGWLPRAATAVTNYREIKAQAWLPADQLARPPEVMVVREGRH